VGTVEASAIVQAKIGGGGRTDGGALHRRQNVAKAISVRDRSAAIRRRAAAALAAVERDKAQIVQAEAVLARDKATARFAKATPSGKRS